MNGFHHLRARVQFVKGLEPFPSTSSLKRILDYVMYGVGVVAPIALIPQIVQIYATKSGKGLSIYTWVLLTIFNSLWAIYGAVHKDRHIFFANSLIVVFDLIIVIGILLY